MFNEESKLIFCIKHTTMLLIVFVSMSISPSTSAQSDEELIMRDMQEGIDAFNTGNIDVMEKYVRELHPDISWFPPNTPFLVHKGKDDVELMRAFYKAGGSMRFDMRQPEIKIFGNAAVMTAYWDGTIIYPGSNTPTPLALRGSYFYVKEKGKWKIVHYHESELPTPN